MLFERIVAELNLTALDIVACVVFLIAWQGYGWLADLRGRTTPSLHNQMTRYRRESMVQMIMRDNRMVDVNVIRNLTRSSQFFASTTMLVATVWVVYILFKREFTSRTLRALAGGTTEH